MIKLVLSFMLLAATVSLAVAQQSSMTATNQGEEAYQPQTALVPRSIEGCLVNNGHRYILAVAGKMPKQYRIVSGDTAPLRGKIGHTVEVNGEAGKSDPREMILNYNMLDATTGVGYDTISVVSVKDVLPNCSFAGFERDTH
jgi:hypothetical protein